ncbi:MAG: FAD-dependent oxidoreductase [Gammaproteobacteria bacterium AqS3]|nr:FAD-dependent oxidoreductase [Gammaproteobacteria bacterium AqS3]
MRPTNIEDPEYFHRVVDCQYACPAHTPVPEYIRLIAQQRYAEAYMVNWESNVFPGILGRTCDRPCEPACRRGRLGDGEEAVAICRLKRVAADLKGDVGRMLPSAPGEFNGRKIALIGAGPASLTVARDLAILGYELHLFDDQKKGGGMMRSQIPAFRLPERVLMEEVDQILNLGVVTHFNRRIDSLAEVLSQDYDAVFVGTGAPRGRDLEIPGRSEGAANIQIGIDFLASVAFGHTSRIGRRVVVLGGGNTAMDCCRTSRRLGGEDVKVVVRSPFSNMKASPWEKEDAMEEDIPILDNHVPKEFIVEDGVLKAVTFTRIEAVYAEDGRRSLVPIEGLDPVRIDCDDVLIAIGQDNSFPWIERDLGIEFDEWDMPVVDRATFGCGHERVFFGGDSAFGPENIITAVAHGHQAAISIDLLCRDRDVRARPLPTVQQGSQRMGIHQWSYDSPVSDDIRHVVPKADKDRSLEDRTVEVELGFAAEIGYAETQRCLNCDVQTVFDAPRCIECDACVDVCPTDCITFTEPAQSEEELRTRLTAPALEPTQPLYLADGLKTGRVMVKDENLCLHCGLCAERCPTYAWDMQKFLYHVTQAREEPTEPIKWVSVL